MANLPYRLSDETEMEVYALIEEYYEKGRNIPVGLGVLVELTEERIDWGIFVNPRLQDLGRADAQLNQRDSYFEIILHNRLLLFRRRIAIAHEIGHVIRDFDYKGTVPRGKAILCRKWLEESDFLAEQIGERLLCPNWAIHWYLRNVFGKAPYQLELFRKHDDWIARLGKMAEVFRVPPLVMARRMRRFLKKELF